MSAYSKSRESSISGFIGGRIDLIPHQLYIANEIANRFCPRVLLSDEVGLGKTIEACLILHRLHLTGRASRILVVVPESLIHQWFIELYRRFNLWFTIMDAERCRASSMQNQQGNPFLEEQLVLVGIDTFTSNQRWREDASNINWDLLIVDEAHHYEWAPNYVSREYKIIEDLSKKSNGLILLTATPEQMGVQGHFARLRLLDENRYPNMENFISEQKDYYKVAKIANALYRKILLSKTQLKDLKNRFKGMPQKDFDLFVRDREMVLSSLIDRHGTGRVVFRNTRNALSGFPKRRVVSHPIPYFKKLSKNLQNERLNNEFEKEIICKDQNKYFYDFKNDARINWLSEFLKKLKGEKVLLICRSREKVEALKKAILDVLKVNLSVFHEGLTLIQRDRNAAYFSEIDGAQILMCSEIGSEGRNFQFAHHLVLFDLPLNPEKLEQRIGRLDRIGQTQTIQIHIPFFQGTWTEVLYLWHNKSLNGIASSLTGGHLYYEAYEEDLIKHCLNYINKDTKNLDIGTLNSFLDECKKYRIELEDSLKKGQDCLIAINSFNPRKANEIIDEINKVDTSEELEDIMHQIFDFFGITVEKLNQSHYFIKPDHLYTDSFPSLPEEGMQVVFNRQVALEREDLSFLTWDHPMVCGAMDLMLGGGYGNSTIVRTKSYYDNLAPLLLECTYILESVAPKVFHVARFLPPSPIRILVDLSGNCCAEKVSSEFLNQVTINEESFRFAKSLDLLKSVIPDLIYSANKHTSKVKLNLIKKAEAKAKKSLGYELERLLELQKLNPNVSDKEIELSRQELTEVIKFIKDSDVRLDSVRLIINNER